MPTGQVIADSSPEIQLRLLDRHSGRPASGIVVVTLWAKNALGPTADDYIGEIYKRLVQTTDTEGRCLIPTIPLDEWHVQQASLIVDPRYEAVTVNYLRSPAFKIQKPPASLPDKSVGLSVDIVLETLGEKYQADSFIGNGDPQVVGSGLWQAHVSRPKCYLIHEIHYIRGENMDHFDWFAWAKAEGRKVDLREIEKEWKRAQCTDTLFVPRTLAELKRFL